ncbi:methylenetetrahydrofolate reductase [bacterium]|nr:methylenetetrahydrofolate reductase [candidate division CSSED10-310 bacterium]
MKSIKPENQLETVIKTGGFAVTAEIMPSKTPDPRIIRKKADLIRGSVTAANLTDNQSAVVRMSSLACSKILLDAGIEPIMQITCRDRNRLAIQSDVLGAAALGVRNILCVSGDHLQFGNHPSARSVFDVDSVQLIRILKTMRDRGCFQNGQPIRNRKTGDIMAPGLFIGAAANPFRQPSRFHPVRLKKKIRAGADFIQTQPVFDINRFRDWMRRIADLGLDQETAILAGVSPVKSPRALIFMKKYIPGIHIPVELISRMEQAGDPRQEGVRIALEIILQLREIPGIRGIHLMAIGWESIIPELVSAARIKTVRMSGLEM